MKRDNQIDDDDDYTTDFRQFDADLGRWLSVDPLMAMFSDVSPYNFNYNNPVNSRDVTGLATETYWPQNQKGGGVIAAIGNAIKVVGKAIATATKTIAKVTTKIAKSISSLYEDSKKIISSVSKKAGNLIAATRKLASKATTKFVKDFKQAIKDQQKDFNKNLKEGSDLIEREFIIYESKSHDDYDNKYQNLDLDADRKDKSGRARNILDAGDFGDLGLGDLDAGGLGKGSSVDEYLDVLKDGITKVLDVASEVIDYVESVNEQIHNEPQKKVTKITNVKRKVALVRKVLRPDGSYESVPLYEDQLAYPVDIYDDSVKVVTPKY